MPLVRCLALVVAALCLPAPAFAQGAVRQFSRQAMIGGRLPASIILFGGAAYAAETEKVIDIVLQRANDTYARLDAANPASDISQLAAQGSVQTTGEVASALESAKKVCEWTNGAFEIVASGGGSCKDLKIGESSVQFKASGAKLDLTPIMSGFMAEMMSKLLAAAGIQDSIVKVGLVFRGRGQRMAEPWKIQVEDDAGTFARHALNLTVVNSGIATVSASQHRGMSSACRGVVAVMGDAALAEGVAYAAFVSGPEKGMAILSKYAKGLVVDGEGKFLRTPSF